jgi:hypothetical protein
MNAPFAIKRTKSKADFVRTRNPNGPDQGTGTFLLELAITPAAATIYLPISIASGKKATGFVYQIEGTAAGTIDTTEITCHGDGVTKITLGTLLYAKIPVGTTATFRFLITIGGKIGKEYTVVINRINYKLHPTDARYTRFDTELRTKTLKFR